MAERLRSSPARIVGAETRPWGQPVDAPVLETASLKGWEHEPGDFTAVIGAAERLGDVQARLAKHGQMLALDPPGDGTVGGLFATADSGPLRHRYGAPRDLIIGVQMALADGTVARGGGRVIKNVAGYDLPKLAAGSFGTLGVITEVCVRLHPLPSASATGVIRCGDPDAVQAAVLDLSRRPLEADALDVRWNGTEGEVLVRFSGSAAADRAARVAGEVVEDDAALWASQRARQRGACVVRVHHLPTQLAEVLRAAPQAVGRGAIGVTYVRCDTPSRLNVALATFTRVVLDGPPGEDPFGLADRPELSLMRAVKARFDLENHCNPGLLI